MVRLDRSEGRRSPAPGDGRCRGAVGPRTPTGPLPAGVLLGLTLLSAALLAPAALGHGAQVTMQEETDGYIVTFHSFDGLTPREDIFVAWNVTDKETQNRTDPGHRNATVRYFEQDGVETASVDKSLNWTQGFLVTKLNTRDAWSIAYHLLVPDGEVVFTQDVLHLGSEGDGPGSGGDGGPNPTPLAGWAVPAALAGAAILLRRSARRSSQGTSGRASKGASEGTSARRAGRRNL